MDISQIKEKALDYQNILNTKKSQIEKETFWYPYGTLNNFIHLDNLLTGEYRKLLGVIGNKPVADIGAADGDTAFFMETLGFIADVVDHAPTNFNTMKGVRLLKSHLSSKIEIYDIDLDSQFSLPRNNYGLIFFLGILYHLKNPYYVLEALAKNCKYCLISTRVTKFGPDKQTLLQNLPVAYLLDRHESNNDPTNFWVFSDTGLKRILDRTGWDICVYKTVGNTGNSDPATTAGDERAFLLVKSRINQ